MTSRQFRIGGLVLSAAYAALGIWALAEARYGTGTFWLVMSVAWMLLALFRNNTLRAQERRRLADEGAEPDLARIFHEETKGHPGRNIFMNDRSLREARH